MNTAPGNSPLTALFIEPCGSLLDTLRDRKAWLAARMPGQPFTSHPPHCTVLFGDYGPVNAWRDALAARLASVTAFELVVDGWQLFANDALAGGGQTVALRAAPADAIFAMQHAVADTLAPFSRADASTHPLAQREPFARSLRSFGFPFVGRHWIPHFTIGSPRVSIEDPLLAELQRAPTRHRFQVEAISLWRVEGDEHTRIETLRLREAAA